MVVIIERFWNSYYGADSNIELKSIMELQDIKCNIVHEPFAKVLEDSLFRILQDKELTHLLLEQPNIKHEDYALIIENERTTLAWYGNLELAFNGVDIDKIVIPDVGYYLLELFD